MTSIIIRPAVQKQWDDEAHRKEWSDREFTHPSWHSAEAKEAWANKKITKGGITAPLMHGDWFALGYDAAKTAMKAHITRFDDDWD